MADESKQGPLINDANLYQSFQLMKRGEFDSAETAIKNGIKESQANCNKEQEGVYYSALGVLWKLKKEYKKSYKAYQQAEKLLKDDHSIRIISALLLIEQFKQYETAVRKLSKVILSTEDPAISHHAKCIQALAYYRWNKKDEAKTLFETDILKQNFAELRFAANVEYKMIEAFVKDGFCPDLCRAFLDTTLKLAKANREQGYITAIESILKLIDQV